MKKKVLILGGGGFIGLNIANLLLQAGKYQIDIADNLSRNDGKINPDLQILLDLKNVRFLKGDYTKLQSFEALDSDYDYVYMLASLVGVDKVNSIPHEVIRVNTLLIINSLEWLRNSNCKRVLFSSTSENYAGTIERFGYKIPTPEEIPLTIDDIHHPRFTYAVTKILGESGFITYSNQSFFESVIVRFHNVYGPRMGFRHVIPHLVERFISGENPFLIYGHDQTRAFNYIDDGVRGTVLAMEKGVSGVIYHIGDDIEITINQLTRYIGDLIGFKGEYKNAPTFPGSVSRRCPDISKAKNDLGYKPMIHWKEGVKKTVDWYTSFLNSASNRTESFFDTFS